MQSTTGQSTTLATEANGNDKNQLDHLRDEIKSGHTKLLHDCIMLGKHLHDARELARDREGGFLGWIKDELGWSRQYAYNYINVYETFGKLPGGAQNLPIGLTAAIELGRPSTPEEARSEVLKLAESGQTVSANTARDIIKKHKDTGSAVRDSDVDPDSYPERKTGVKGSAAGQFGDGNSKLPATDAQAQYATRLLIKQNYDNNQEAIAALAVGYPDEKEIARVCQEKQGQDMPFKVSKALAQSARDVIKQELQAQLGDTPTETFAEQLSQPSEEVFKPPFDTSVPGEAGSILESEAIITALNETINSLRVELQSKDEEIKQLREQLAQLESL
ncbi:MAG: hypothetical protein AAF267_01685 [Deinococcota bacterium]